MFLSDEPGYYSEGEWGLRLENILQVLPANTNTSEYGEFIRYNSRTDVSEIIRYTTVQVPVCHPCSL